MKKYRLLKDLPGIKAGVIFEPTQGSDYPGMYVIRMPLPLGFPVYWGSYLLEKEKDWFEDFSYEETKNIT